MLVSPDPRLLFEGFVCLSDMMAMVRETLDGAMARQGKRQVSGARLVTAGFIGRFDELVKEADSVWLASAWITRSKALDRLATRRQRVRVVAGIHGNATDPDAIQSLIGSGCGVRVVEGGALFHPKLYLFRRRRGTTVGWIGSANFTAAGLAGNREVILELDDERAISEMESWFDTQWCALKGQDVEAVLHNYRRARDRDGVAPDLVDLVEGQETPLAAGEIRIHPKPKTGKGFPGEFEYGDGEIDAYDSFADGLRRLLVRLAEGRDEFFDNCAGKTAYKKGSKPSKPRIIQCSEEARARALLAVRPGISISRLADSQAKGQAWWLSEDSNTPEKWAMAKAAVEVFNEMSGNGRQLRLADVSLKSWPRTV